MLEKDSVTIHHGNLRKLATEMYRLENNLSPKLLKSIISESNNHYDLRSENPFQTDTIRTVC